MLKMLSMIKNYIKLYESFGEIDVAQIAGLMYAWSTVNGVTANNWRTIYKDLEDGLEAAVIDNIIMLY
jgi:hypothetical protein